MALLELKNVNSGYGDVQIIWDVSLTLEKGRLTSLVGGNGVGKTTLLRTIMSAVRPWSGSILWNGKEIGGTPAYRKAEMGLALVPEGRQLFTDMTVYENLEMGATNRRARARMNHNLSRVFDLLPRLAERRSQLAGTLSGGEQQMLAVGRGLMAEPELLMVDELSLGLAPVLAISLLDTMRRLKDDGLTILLVEQNVHMALTISDHAYVISEGRVTISGPAEQVAGNKEVQKAYLGI